MNPASGIVTFLFTDIEGSTRRWEADADAMAAALLRHDDVLREAVTGCGGSIFKHTGDGICAAFGSPRAAVDAAIAAQRSLELPVRMGIATGEAEPRGGDYFGAVLNRVARVMGCGHGGQILLDGVTSALISGVDLVDLGPRRLRDLAQPVQMYQVRAPGLRADFPALKTLESTVGNLRPQTTSFVGRDDELAELTATLESHRLVTLTGVGGVGKTRLALEVAARISSRFPDGVWVIELAPIGDPAAVPDAVAAVLGIKQQPGMSLAESVGTALDGRSRLLVFDNCEHVLDAVADLVETIFSRSATVRILATSREGMRAIDEQVWSVPSLDVATGADSAAAALFIQRANAVAQGISLDRQDEAAAVGEICQRLDGIPLAIELAASRMVSMTAVELRDRLDDRFRLLVGSRRGLERHQTLRHAVQWSCDLLDDDEKSLLTRCSVFAGGFDLAAARTVGDCGDELATLDLLDALVRKSLLVADRTAGRTRFSMLETIRQFAEDQLVHSGEAVEVRTAHARYFAGLERGVLDLWNGPRQREAYSWLSTELANLRAAFRWATDHDDLDTAAAIAICAAALGYWVGQHEPAAWAEELIEAAQSRSHPRLAQLYVMAAQCFISGRVDDFLDYAEAGRAAVDSGGFDDVPDEFETWLSGGYLTAGEVERCIEWCRDTVARGSGHHTFVRASLVLALCNAGADEEAMAESQRVLADSVGSANPEVVSWALFAYGMAHRNTDPAGAYDAHRRGLKIARDNGNPQVEAHHAARLSTFATIHGEPDAIFEYLTLAIRNYYDTGSFSFMSSALAILAIFFDHLGHSAPAATLSGFAADPFSHAAVPEIDTAITHLREVLGEAPYEELARTGENMTIAEAATYAFQQIDLARAEFT
jgi:predicted ATPase